MYLFYHMCLFSVLDKFNKIKLKVLNMDIGRFIWEMTGWGILFGSVRCPNCDEKIARSDKYCPHCGHQIPWNKK